jgi:hypothetical protein
MTDTTHAERRARMLEKVRKLLAMARDGRGNATESETAMRQANKLMAEFGIEEAEFDMQQLDSDAMVFGEAMSGPDGRAPAQGKVYRTMPTWVGMLAVGIGRFTDTIVSRRRTENGEMLVFRGEREDVLLARWLLGVLVEAIEIEKRASGWTGKGEANSFRVAAVSTLCRRLRDLAAERRAMYEDAKRTSGSRALMVVDRKAVEVAKRFGTQKTKTSRSSYSSSGAAMAGRAAGSRINIPSGRPVGCSRVAIGH